jgi:hypothetical protein
MLKKANGALKEAMRLKESLRGRNPVQWQLFTGNTDLPSQKAREPIRSGKYQAALPEESILAKT